MAEPGSVLSDVVKTLRVLNLHQPELPLTGLTDVLRYRRVVVVNGCGGCPCTPIDSLQAMSDKNLLKCSTSLSTDIADHDDLRHLVLQRR